MIIGMTGDTALRDEDLRRIRMELNDLIAKIGPRDRHGILLLSPQQRDDIDAFMDWIEDAFGEIQ